MLSAKQGKDKDRAQPFPSITNHAHPTEDPCLLRRLPERGAEQKIEPHRDAEHRGRRDAADNQEQPTHGCLAFARWLEHRGGAIPRFVKIDCLDDDVGHFAPVARRENAHAMLELFGHAQIELRHLFGLALATGPQLRQGFPEIAFHVFACRRRAMPKLLLHFTGGFLGTHAAPPLRIMVGSSVPSPAAAVIAATLVSSASIKASARALKDCSSVSVSERPRLWATR